MPRISWIEDANADGELASLYDAMRQISATGQVDDIVRCLSHRPDFLAALTQAARLHFSDGALSRAQHEMIASRVAGLNRTHYCLTGHTYFLQLQGGRHQQTAQALRDGDLDAADLTPAERLLLEFVSTLTTQSSQITDEQVQGLREVGWADAQIAEAVYDAALFNLFVRVADAFGIHPPEFMEPDGPPRALARTAP
jgi:uncharacterized peroxidase-related enzyme